jgi:hypothetical protein
MERRRREALNTFCIIYPITTVEWVLFIYLFTHSLTHSLTNLLTYLLTPWGRVLLEKLTGSQLVKKFPAFYGNLRFITAFTSVRHLSLFWVRPIKSIPPIPLLKIHLNIILPSTPGSPHWSLSRRFPYHNTVHASPLPINATCPAHHIFLDFITRAIYGEECRSLSSSLCSFLQFPVTSSLLSPNILLNTLFSNTHNLRSSRSNWV